MDTIRYKIIYPTKEAAFDALFGFYHRKDLNNPELTVMLKNTTSGQTEMHTFSGNKDSTALPERRKWEELTASPRLDGVTCVVGVDKADTRRVVVAYMNMPMTATWLIISFPMAKKGLNKKEMALLASFKNTEPMEDNPIA